MRLLAPLAPAAAAAAMAAAAVRVSAGQEAGGRHHPLLCLITGEDESRPGCTSLNGPAGRSLATVQSPVMEIFNI